MYSYVDGKRAANRRREGETFVLREAGRGQPPGRGGGANNRQEGNREGSGDQDGKDSIEGAARKSNLTPVQRVRRTVIQNTYNTPTITHACSGHRTLWRQPPPTQPAPQSGFDGLLTWRGWFHNQTINTELRGPGPETEGG